MTEAVDAVRTLLSPRSILLVGASRRPSPSQSILNSLREYGFPGELHLVNPSGESIQGYPTHPTIGHVPVSADVALIVVPAVHVPDAVFECGKAGVRVAVVYSAGFEDDRDPAGATRQQALADAVTETGIRVMGPNSQGFFNVGDQIPATFSSSVFAAEVAANFADGDISRARGAVSIVAQSGGMGFSMFGRGLRRGMGFSRIMSCGNEVDLELCDYVEFLVDDEATEVILLYIEGLKDPARFVTLAARAERAGKRLVAGKVGRSSAAARAALSHTGHLAGDDAAYGAVFDRYGIIRVDDAEEMLDVALALSSCPVANGNRVGIVSYSGGNAVWMADAAASHDLDVLPLSDGVQDALRAELPSFAAVTNPVDVSGASKRTPGEVLAMVAGDPNVDSLVLISTFNKVERLEADRPALEGLVHETGKPVLVYSYTEPSEDAKALLHKLRLPFFDSTTRSARALAALAAVGTHRPEPPLPPNSLQWCAELAQRCNENGWGKAATVCEYEVKRVLGELGVPVTQEALASSAAEAVAVAGEIGYPVALKVQSPDIAHKARVGGVVLGVSTADEVRHGFDAVLESVRQVAPEAEIHGVLVQEMVPSGVEVIAGVQNTSGLGPMVLAGIGGGAAELVDRSVLYPAPFGAVTARTLLHRLRLDRVLPDLVPLADLLSQVSALAWALADTVAELDLNPVIVNPSTGAATVVDALAVPTPQ
jgi:acyl-CoA synthetase (NDP forming)